MEIKNAMGILGLLLAATVAEARADFIPIPLQCEVVAHGEPTGILVSLSEEEGRIGAVLLDRNDRADLACRKVPVEPMGLAYLDCSGRWESDGSAATFSASMGTFVPFVTVQRSGAGFGGKMESGLCGKP